MSVNKIGPLRIFASPCNIGVVWFLSTFSSEEIFWLDRWAASHPMFHHWRSSQVHRATPWKFFSCQEFETPKQKPSNQIFPWAFHILRDRNWRPEGGEWEPIKISFEIDPSAYIPKITTNPQILDEIWSSYRRAKPTQITPRNEREKARKRSRKTADLAVRDRSDRLLWAVRPVGLDFKFQTDQTGCCDRSDRFWLE